MNIVCNYQKGSYICFSKGNEAGAIKTKAMKKVTGKRLDNGEWVIGELFTWSKFTLVAIVCDDSHERVSDGWRVCRFSIKEII